MTPPVGELRAPELIPADRTPVITLFSRVLRPAISEHVTGSTSRHQALPCTEQGLMGVTRGCQRSSSLPTSEPDPTKAMPSARHPACAKPGAECTDRLVSSTPSEVRATRGPKTLGTHESVHPSPAHSDLSSEHGFRWPGPCPRATTPETPARDHSPLRSGPSTFQPTPDLRPSLPVFLEAFIYLRELANVSSLSLSLSAAQGRLSQGRGPCVWNVHTPLLGKAGAGRRTQPPNAWTPNPSELFLSTPQHSEPPEPWPVWLKA